MCLALMPATDKCPKCDTVTQQKRELIQRIVQEADLKTTITNSNTRKFWSTD
jgi:hypothetical protein